ncbi:hypothetical protein N7532_004644 [Penicillium argentinense]|uniref:NmrA-like domain-containing protein n=1 Tax=Penicillium argentinense TaxID=1131581 RepID=A0A9W9KF29_9EURO|nr:uncharacterized protein N7532_004644 [Penicillium argentinense]KAJ5104115.1 hypothetical protein N7532_004644 [Penicillium argentinense]
MLVLIAGITGKLGKHLARAALQRGGFRVRGLGRHPENLDPTIALQLESFVTCRSHDDIAALNRAVESVDAVVCAYKPDPVLNLEGHLLLLRAAEQAGIKIFHASSWNADWRLFGWGEFEHYDTHIAFQRHVEMTSSIKPVYVFTGMFGEYLFSPAGPGMFSKEESGAASVQIWNKGDAKWAWTSMKDAAEFSIDLLTRNDVKEGAGGYFAVKSGEISSHDIARAYENVTGFKVDVIYVGHLDSLDQQVQQARQDHGPSEYKKYLPLELQLFGYRGKFELQNAETIVNGRRTISLEDLLRGNPEIAH